MMNPAEFENIARVEESHWWFDGMNGSFLAMLRRALNGVQPGRILEAGCGTGAFAETLKREFECAVDAMDLAPEGLRYVRSRLLDGVVQADIRALPFCSGSYDLAVSLDVLVHFPRGGERPAIAELARILRPGGLLALRVSALDVLRSRHSEFTLERQRFTRPRLLEEVERAGLKPVRGTYANSLLLPVSLFKFRVWEPLTRAEPASGVQPLPNWLDRTLRSVLWLESKWLAQGRGFPAGQSLVLFARKP